MPKRSPAKLKEKVPPEKRLALEQETENNMQLARKLLKDKKYKESFKQFKNALATADSTVFPETAEIATLAKNYRPAMVALKKWRNQKERLILAQAADSTVIYQWEKLNACLNEKDRILIVFRKLRAAGANKRLLDSFYWKLWNRLVKEKRYEELRTFFDTLGWMTLLHVSEHHAQSWFPRKCHYHRHPRKLFRMEPLCMRSRLH